MSTQSVISEMAAMMVESQASSSLHSSVSIKSTPSLTPSSSPSLQPPSMTCDPKQTFCEDTTPLATTNAHDGQSTSSSKSTAAVPGAEVYEAPLTGVTVNPEAERLMGFSRHEYVTTTRW
jgi:hypothetical protein